MQPPGQSLPLIRDAIQRGDWLAAHTAAEAELARDPNSADAHHAVGVAYLQTDRPEAAVYHLEQSVRLRPEARWLNNLGVAYITLSQWAEARDAFKRSLDLRPDDATTRAHYGRALCQLGDYEDARRVLEQTVTDDPEQAAAWVDLGRALIELGMRDDSHYALMRAIELCPESARARRTLVRVCRELRRFAESSEHARILTGLEPGAEPFTELALALWREGEIKASLEAVERAFGFGIAQPDVHSALLFLMLFDPAQSGPRLADAHLSWAITHGPRSQPRPAFAGRISTGRRLRIGYLAADLFTTPARYSRLPLLIHADREHFDLFVYGTQVPAQSEDRHLDITANYRNVHCLTDSELLTCIRQDEIDILVDLVGHHNSGRLRVFANRAAPVQVAYTCYPGTTGLHEMDYFLTDAETTPAGTEDEYSEELWRMPSGYLMYSPPPAAPPVGPLPARANGFVTFGLFQRESKMNDSCWDAVARILITIPSSHLLLHSASPRFDNENGESPASSIAALESRGIARDRLIFKGRRPMKGHLEIIAEADIALDTFPYNGHTTTCECLWMGVPVVTLSGDRHAARVSAGLLRQAGLDRWIARTVDDYIEIATRAARDVSSLERLRTGLRTQLERSPLLDIRTRTREIEDFYRHAWARWVQRGPRNSRFHCS